MKGAICINKVVFIDFKSDSLPLPQEDLPGPDEGGHVEPHHRAPEAEPPAGYRAVREGTFLADPGPAAW